MAKIKRSIVWTIDYTQLLEIVNSSNSIVEILQKLNLNAYNGNHRTLKARCLEDGIDLNIVKKRGYDLRMKNLKLKNKFNNDIIFRENSSYSSNKQLKKYLFEMGWENKCAECGQGPIWNGKPLTLQLEHKNGINNDNRLNNLCFLCPCCHSQTATFAGRNSSIIKRIKNGADSQDRTDL